MGFNLDNYEPVATRLQRFLDAGIEPRVITDMVHRGDGWCVFKASLYFGEVLVSTGWAEEHATDRGVNATSHVENCETSALGRMCEAYLPNPDWTKRPSREEMAKVERGASTSGTPFTGTKTITNKMKGKCIHCGGTVEVGEGIATNNGSGWKTSHIEGQCTPEPF